MRAGLAHWLLRGSAAIAAATCLLAQACASLDRPAPHFEPLSSHVRISASWLRAQPGLQLGGLSLHLLDADSAPLEDWHGLQVSPTETGSGASGIGLTFSATQDCPDDIYLYVVYDGGSLAFDGATLDDARRGEWAMLAMPGRIHDVLVFGLARLAPNRGRPLPPGPLFSLRFTSGSELHFKSLSLVNDDPRCAPTLSAELVGGQARISWTEQNLGDYDNNSQVTISDLTPLAANFGQTVANAEDPLAAELVDGDGNGEINISDLTPIASHFLRYIEGYSVYCSTDPDPGADSYTALGQPAVLRLDVLSAATPVERKHRLKYSYDPQTGPGLRHFYLRAWSGDGGQSSEGAVSNTVSIDIPAGNSPPVWDSSPPIIAAVGIAESAQITFSNADDPEGTSVTYVLRYIDASLGGINSLGVQSVDLIEESFGAGPPFTYLLTGLTQGAIYHLNIQARDEDGYRTANQDVVDVLVPMVGLSSDPWSAWRGGNHNIGASTTAGTKEPLVPLWNTPISAQAANSPFYSLLLSQDGYFAVEDDLQRILRLRSDDGSIIATSAALPSKSKHLGMSLGQDVICCPTDSGLALWDTGKPGNTPQQLGSSPIVSSRAVGDYILTISPTATTFYTRSGLLQLWSHPLSCGDLVQFPAPMAFGGGPLYAGAQRILQVDLPLGQSAQELVSPGQVIGLMIDPGTQELLVVRQPTANTLELVGYGQAWEMPWNNTDAHLPPLMPCMVRSAIPPLLIFPEGPAGGAVLSAYDANGLETEWTCPSLPIPAEEISAITAGNQRLFVCGQDKLCVLDFNGLLRQTISLGDLVASEAVPFEDKIAILTRGGLRCFKTDSGADGPPVWQGVSAKPGGGIRTLTSGAGGLVSVGWDYAVDDHDLPVYYSVYYSPDQAPEFSAPFTHTTVVKDIADAGVLSHSFDLGPLDEDRRWYVGVRAYDRPWNEAPNLDPNTNWLAITPEWQEERLRVGPDLPASEIYFMRGLLDPGGQIHIVYNDRATAKLVHLFGATGSWSTESSGLAPYPCSGFEPAWNDASGELAIAIANSSNVGVLTRSGPDTWNYSNIASAQPVANPMCALAFPPVGSGEAALTYTKQTNASFPPPEEYEICQTNSGIWQAPAPLDALNNSGRDLSMLLNPLDDSDPWTLMQRGYEYAPNHLTPQRGELCIGRSDGAGGWTLDVVDGGANAPNSDCGKRCRLLRSGSDTQPILHAAYFDLNASSSQALGALKYARFENGSWSIEGLAGFDLSFQTGSLQFTYGELGLTIHNGEPAMAMLVRSTAGGSASDPHLAQLWLWRRQADGTWKATPLSDSLWQFPRDREPCVLLAEGGILHVFYATLSDDQDPKADTVVHLWRDYGAG